MNVIGAVLLIHRERIKDEPRETALVAAGLGEIGHVRRQAAAERGASRLIVGERRREIVGDFAGPLEHLTLIIRAIGDLEGGRDRGGLSLAEAGTAGIGEIAERQQLEAVAGRADLAIDLEAALQLLRIVLAERTGKRPMLQRRRIALLRTGLARSHDRQRGCQRRRR